MGKTARLADRTVTMRVLPDVGARSVGDVVAKRIRGDVARYLVQSRAQPNSPDELADALADSWPARLEPPTPRNPGWTILVRPAD
jgi:hypothetical protein